jgi:hypothetical protein
MVVPHCVWLVCPPVRLWLVSRWCLQVALACRRRRTTSTERRCSSRGGDNGGHERLDGKHQVDLSQANAAHSSTAGIVE